MGHEVTVFHREETAVELPKEVNLIKGDRHQLSEYKQELQKHAPQVVLDTIPYTASDAEDIVDTFKDIAERIVTIDSQDVYCARDIIWQKEANITDRHESLIRTIIWERENPPEEDLPKGYSKLLNYQDEDVILGNLSI